MCLARSQPTLNPSISKVSPLIPECRAPLGVAQKEKKKELQYNKKLWYTRIVVLGSFWVLITLIFIYSDHLLHQKDLLKTRGHSTFFGLQNWSQGPVYSISQCFLECIFSLYLVFSTYLVTSVWSIWLLNPWPLGFLCEDPTELH